MLVLTEMLTFPSLPFFSGNDPQLRWPLPNRLIQQRRHINTDIDSISSGLMSAIGSVVPRESNSDSDSRALRPGNIGTPSITPECIGRLLRTAHHRAIRFFEMKMHWCCRHFTSQCIPEVGILVLVISSFLIPTQYNSITLFARLIPKAVTTHFFNLLYITRQLHI